MLNAAVIKSTLDDHFKGWIATKVYGPNAMNSAFANYRIYEKLSEIDKMGVRTQSRLIAAQWQGLFIDEKPI